MRAEGAESRLRQKSRKSREKVLETVPGLKEGINLIDKPSGVPVFQELLGHHLEPDSEALWIDTGNEASTYALASQDRSLMERVRIARAFTPFQHHTLSTSLGEYSGSETEVMVLPRVNQLYLESGLKEWERRELFQEAWSSVMRLQEEKSLKVMVSAVEDSETGSMVKADSDNRIEVGQTSQGRRYVSDSFRQLTYPGDGYIQTTVPMWRKV